MYVWCVCLLLRGARTTSVSLSISIDASVAFASGGMRKFRFLTFDKSFELCSFMFNKFSVARVAVPTFIPSVFISAA